MGGNVVAAEGGADDAFLEEEAVMDGSYGEGGGADIDYEGGGFASGEAVGCKCWLSEWSVEGGAHAARTPFRASQ